MSGDVISLPYLTRSGDVMLLPYLVMSGEVMGLYLMMSGDVSPPNLVKSKGLRAVGQKRGEVLSKLLH